MNRFLLAVGFLPFMFLLTVLWFIACKENDQQAPRGNQREKVILTDETVEEDKSFQAATDDEENPIFRDFRPDKQRFGYKSGIIELK